MLASRLDPSLHLMNVPEVVARRRFAAKHFHTTPSPAFLERFFDGYDDPEAFAAWFDWLTPALLRKLERELAARPSALDDLTLVVGWRG